MQQDGRALQYASAELKADKDVVLAAVRQEGVAFLHASAELQADPVLKWFAKYRDELTEVFGEDRLNYKFLAEKYESRALNLVNKSLEEDIEPNDPDPTPMVIRLAQEALAALTDTSAKEAAGMPLEV